MNWFKPLLAEDCACLCEFLLSAGSLLALDPAKSVYSIQLPELDPAKRPAR